MALTRRLVGWSGSHLQALGLSVLFVTFAMAISWFVAFFIPGQRRTAIDSWRRDLDVRADIRKEALQRYFIDGLANAETLAAYPTALQVPAMRSGAGRPMADVGMPDAHLEGLFSDFVRIHKVLGVVLWDSNGTPSVKNRDLVLAAACATPAREVLVSGASATGFHIHEAFGPVLSFSALVRFANGDVGGAVVVEVDPREWLYPLLAQPLAGTSTGEAFLVGRDGADILYLSPLRNRPGAPLSFRHPFDDAGLPARAALEGSEIVGPLIDYRGVRVLSAGRRLPPSPWALVVKVDEGEGLAAVRRNVLQRGIAWGTLLVAASAMAFGLWRAQAMSDEIRIARSEMREHETRAQAAVARSELAALVESSEDAMITKDLNDVVVSWNASAERIFGYRADEMVGIPIQRIIPEDLWQEEAQIRERVVRGERVDHFETARMRKDGTPLDMSLSVSPIKDSDGSIVGTSKVMRDITDRRRAETVLKESEARYRTLLENIPEKIFMKSRSFRYVSVNENYARDLGIRPEDAVGKVDEELFPKDLADKYRADDKRVMETAQTEEFEERYLQGGREIWIHTVKTPVRDRSGEVIGVLGVFRDITERKRAEDELRTSEGRLRAMTEELESRVETRTAELEAANRELEAFSYSVSHDLRAPLRAVDGFSRILLEEHASQLDAEGRRLLDVVRSNSRQMGQLIDDLLSFSRIGRQEMTRTEVDMEALAMAALRELGGDGGGVSFTVGPLPRPNADPSLMRQVLMNLISNALKFTAPRENRIVELGARSEPGRIVYWVKDNGVGFDMAYANKLFGVFQRLHSATEFEGTGVGLALVQRIVHRHGGQVWAEGNVGEGATFSFSLPRAGGS